MIRIDRQITRELILLLIWIRERNGRLPSPDDLYETFRGAIRHHQGGEDEEAAREALEGWGETQLVDLTDLLTQLRSQLQLEQSEDGSPLLIDKIADILQDNGATSILSGRVLAELRRTVLTGLEMEGLMEKLHQKEFHCEMCQKILHQGEMVVMGSYRPLRDEHPRSVIYCSRCSIPTTVACSDQHCDGCAETPTKIHRWMRKGHKCQHHAREVDKRLEKPAQTQNDPNRLNPPQELRFAPPPMEYREDPGDEHPLIRLPENQPPDVARYRFADGVAGERVWAAGHPPPPNYPPPVIPRRVIAGRITPGPNIAPIAIHPAFTGEGQEAPARPPARLPQPRAVNPFRRIVEPNQRVGAAIDRITQRVRERDNQPAAMAEAAMRTRGLNPDALFNRLRDAEAALEVAARVRPEEDL